MVLKTFSKETRNVTKKKHIHVIYRDGQANAFLDPDQIAAL